MDNEPWADIYAAMADGEEEENAARAMDKPLINPGQLNLFGGKSAPLVVGSTVVDVATLAYVQRLEKIVQTQDQAIKKLERTARAMEQSLRQTRTVANNGQGRLAEIARELDSKVNKRD